MITTRSSPSVWNIWTQLSLELSQDRLLNPFQITETPDVITQIGQTYTNTRSALANTQ